MSIPTTTENMGLPVACSLEAGEMAKRGAELRRQLFAHVVARRELPNGVAYRFPGSEELKDKLLDFVGTERNCCAFFRIELAFEPGLGPIWLTLSGPPGVKEFIEQTFEGKTQGAATRAPRIGREEVKTKLDRHEDVIIVESLPEMYYRRAHLPGAINIPVEQMPALAPQLLLDKDTEIIVYCANLPCPSSSIAARFLIDAGYTHVREYAEGKQDWIEAGYPTERGPAARAG